MPISLRIPLNLETQIADYSVRQGLSKSAVIVRSIEEFLAKNAQPSAYQIYLDVMQSADAQKGVVSEVAEPRAHKLVARQAAQRKHAQRSAMANQASMPKPTPARRKAA